MNILLRNMEVPVKENAVADPTLQEILEIQSKKEDGWMKKLGYYIHASQWAGYEDQFTGMRVKNYAALQIMTYIETDILIDAVKYAYLYEDGAGIALVRSYARDELFKRMKYAHIIKHDRNGMCEYACIHCGVGFDTTQFFEMGKHGTETECINHWKHLTCPCGKTCESIDKAHTHRLFHITIDHAKKKAQEQKEHKKEYNTQHNPQRKTVSCCDVCGVSFRCKKEEERHMNGKEHKYKVKPKEINNCKLCGTTTDMTPAQYQAHIHTKKHLKKVEEAQTPKRKVIRVKVSAIQQ